MPAEREERRAPILDPISSFSGLGTKNRFFERPHFTHFWASGLSATCRPCDLESNAMIGIEFYEFRQKLKKFEIRTNSSFWYSLRAIWIDSMSFGLVSPLSMFFHFFSILVKLSIFYGNVNYFLGNCQLLMEV